MHIGVVGRCGLEGMSIDLSNGVYNMTGCCNKHDVCYDTCNANRDSCDKEFKNCMAELCDNEHPGKKGCKAIVNTYYTGVVAMGCSPYLESQADACSCPGEQKETNAPSQTETTE